MVAVDLADILAPPSEDAAASKKHRKRITGARERIANEYTSNLKEEERKKKKQLKKKKGKRSEQKTLMPSPLDSYASPNREIQPLFNRTHDRSPSSSPTVTLNNQQEKATPTSITIH